MCLNTVSVTFRESQVVGFPHVLKFKLVITECRQLYYRKVNKNEHISKICSYSFNTYFQQNTTCTSCEQLYIRDVNAGSRQRGVWKHYTKPSHSMDGGEVRTVNQESVGSRGNIKVAIHIHVRSGKTQI